jgi:hypothetical protein
MRRPKRGPKSARPPDRTGRGPGLWESGLQRLDELQQTLRLLGLPAAAHIGPIEQQCYKLQHLLSTEERESGVLRPTRYRTFLMRLSVPRRWRLRLQHLPPLPVSHWAHLSLWTSGTPGLNNDSPIC